MTHGHLFEREASLVREETTLEAGETRWRFDLTLSSSMACFERNRHGIVQYFLSAEATAIGWLEASVRSVIRPILPNAEVSSQIRIRRKIYSFECTADSEYTQDHSPLMPCPILPRRQYTP
jgi:hypothetical protein